MGVHFFYPAPVMKLIELIRGVATSHYTFETVKGYTLNLGKTVVDALEYTRFIVNRVLFSMQNKAAFMVM